MNTTYGNSYRDCAEKCPDVTIPLAQGEAASTTTSADTSLITYTHTKGETTSMLASRPMAVCTASTSSSLQAGTGVSRTASGSLAKLTGSAASATKSSAACPLLGGRNWVWDWRMVGLGALVQCVVWEW